MNVMVCIDIPEHICVRKCHHLYDITFLSVAMLLFFPRILEFPMEKEQLFSGALGAKAL